MSKEAEQPTLRALQKCAEWIAYCLDIKFADKSQIEQLEKIWWEHHDFRGNLITTKNVTNEQA